MIAHLSESVAPVVLIRLVAVCAVDLLAAIEVDRLVHLILINKMSEIFERFERDVLYLQ